MDWMDRTVTVTGAAGFIGSHLTDTLLTLGATVRAVCHGDPQYHRGFLRPQPGLEITGGDLRDASFARDACAGADTVFHLGAVTSVAYSYSHPEETFAVNALGTMNVCAAARQAKVRRLIHTSTAGVYGNATDGKPITETHPVGGANPYCAGKLAGDNVVQAYHLSYGLPAATLRLFNIFGPRMGRYLIMPTIIQQLMQSPVLHLGDLTPTRTFLYVDDAVRAFLSLATADEALGEVVHVGGQEEISMATLVEEIAGIMGIRPLIEQDPARLRPAKSEIYRVSADCTKARQLLSWVPEVELSDGLTRTIAWIRSGGYARERAG